MLFLLRHPGAARERSERAGTGRDPVHHAVCSRARVLRSVRWTNRGGLRRPCWPVASQSL